MIALSAGTVIAGRYRLERPLARGGMGSLWVARHLALDAEVAIKFMTPEYAASAEARARFEREAKAAAQLRSPHVVQVHDYGAEEETPFIVMELLVGEDLEARLKRHRRLSLQATGLLLDQVGKALRVAHDLGLVHRDLKPANLFLARHAGDEIVKILDFGIAKQMDRVTVGVPTKTGTLIGSPFYMSPEQMRRSKLVDHRSDLWSLGVIAYQCLAGRVPYSGEELVELVVEVCTEPISPPSHFAPDLPPGVDRFMEKALARDPNLRFQSATELAEAYARLVLPSRASAPALPEPLAAPRSEPGGPQGTMRSDGARGFEGTPPPSSPDPSASTPAPGSGTLAPAGHTLSLPKSTKRHVGILVAFAGAVLVGVTTIVLLRPSGDVQSGVTSSELAAVPPQPTTPATTAPPSPSTVPSDTAAPVTMGPQAGPNPGPAEPGPVATRTPEPRPEASAPRARPQPAASVKAPSPRAKGASKKATDDPLDAR